MKIWTQNPLAVSNLQRTSRASEPTRTPEAQTDSVDLTGLTQYVEAASPSLDAERITALRNSADNLDLNTIAGALISRGFDRKGEL